METKPQDYVIGWIQSLFSEERIGYLKRLIDCCPQEDLKPLRVVLSNTVKRKSQFPRNFAKKLRLGLQPGSSPQVASASSSVVPVSTKVEKFWWETYSEEDIVGLDCEMVTLKKRNTKGKYINQAATVGLVNLKRRWGKINSPTTKYQDPQDYFDTIN